MINGLQVDVKSAELKSIVAGRVKYHTEQAATYEQESAQLKVSLKRVHEEVSHGKVSNGADISQQLMQKAQEHKDKAVHFQFMLDHVIQDDIYRLGQADLQLLGIATRGFY